MIDLLRDNRIVTVDSDFGKITICSAISETACTEMSQNLTGEKTLLVDRIQMLERFVPDFHEICYDLIETATKPLTIIYPSFRQLPACCGHENGTIAIQVTSDPNLQSVIRELRHPLLSCSTSETTLTDHRIHIGLGGEVKVVR